MQAAKVPADARTFLVRELLPDLTHWQQLLEIPEETRNRVKILLNDYTGSFPLEVKEDSEHHQGLAKETLSDKLAAAINRIGIVPFVRLVFQYSVYIERYRMPLSTRIGEIDEAISRISQRISGGRLGEYLKQEGVEHADMDTTWKRRVEGSDAMLKNQIDHLKYERNFLMEKHKRLELWSSYFDAIVAEY